MHDMEKSIPFTAALIILFGLIGIARSVAQQPDQLPDFAPLLPQVKARAWAVDPQKGYAVRELTPGLFMITDGGYQSIFATTGNGVVLFDAPPSFASISLRLLPT
jgi:hypothetical protein